MRSFNFVPIQSDFMLLWKSALRNTNENIQDNQVILTVSCKVRLGLQEGVHLRQELDRGFTVLVGI